jgi:hypothetical protein
MQNNCCIDFQELLNEKLKDPEFKKGFEKEGIKTDLELKFNQMLQEMGYNDLYVDILEIDEY